MKATGDGFIAYIDHPSFTSQCDAAADLGLALLVVLQETLNPVLLRNGLAELAIRIGADHGDAISFKIEIPATGYETQDVASDAINRAVKIQESCDTNEFRIGRTLYELLHVQWLERGTEVSFPAKSLGLERYQVYRMT